MRGGKKTSSLLGLFLSTLKYLYQDKYTASEYTYQILRAAHKDDIGLDENVSSVIHSGYYWDTGLNLTWAGSTSGSDGSSGKLTANAAFIRQSGNQEATLQDSCRKVERVRLALKMAVNLTSESLRVQTAVEEQVSAIVQALRNVELCQAMLDREDLRKSLARATNR